MTTKSPHLCDFVVVRALVDLYAGDLTDTKIMIVASTSMGESLRPWTGEVRNCSPPPKKKNLLRSKVCPATNYLALPPFRMWKERFSLIKPTQSRFDSRTNTSKFSFLFLVLICLK